MGMTPERVQEACDTMRAMIRAQEQEVHTAKRMDGSVKILVEDVTDFNIVVCHALNCLDLIPVFMNEGRVEKAMRWLGWVQGVLFALGLMTIDDGAKMNMPKDAVFSDDKGVSKPA